MILSSKSRLSIAAAATVCSGFAMAMSSMSAPPVVQGGEVRDFERWMFLAEYGEEMRFHETTRVRLEFENGKWTEKTFRAGDVAVCNAGTFGGFPDASYRRHVCRRHVATTRVKEYRPQATMPYVDERLDMAPAWGIREQSVQPGSTPAKPSDTGAFRISCRPSRMAFDDPIVYPGQPGRSHHHTFYGNTAVDAFTTDPAAVGHSTCAGGTINRSGYWVPSIIDTRFGAAIGHASLMVYYKGHNLTVPPPGLRMVTGDMHASAPGRNYRFGCHSPKTGPYAQGSGIPHCKVGDTLTWEIWFPQCWDGRNLDSTDHKSHMAFRQGDRCPASHPMRIPDIAFNFTVVVRPGDDTRRWRLASDHYGWDKPGGYSSHADWFNGWDQNWLTDVVQNCLNRKLDCSANMVRDGRRLHF